MTTGSLRRFTHFIVVLVALFTSVPGLAQSWVQSPINYNWYKLVSVSTTWKDGESQAIKDGGHLATIRSQQEQDWVVKTFGKGDYWIGFTDEPKEGTWVWTSRDSSTYTNWATGEPGGGTLENWALISSQLGGKWIDEQSWKKSQFLIEVPGKYVTPTYNTFGEACKGTGGYPSLIPNIPPRIGMPFSIILANLPLNQPGLILPCASSDKNWGLFPLPLPLDPLGATGCKLYVSGYIPPLILSPAPLGAIVWGMNIPSELSLLGVQFFNQAILLDPGSNPAGFIVTNAGSGTIGSPPLQNSSELPGNGLIAFTSYRNSPGHYIYTMKPSGLEQTPFLETSGCYVPRWAPDGKSLLFVGYWVPYGTWLMRADGHVEGLIRPQSEEPTWVRSSPREILLRVNNDPRGIYSVNQFGAKRLTNSSGGIYDTRPDWSERAQKIVFVSNRDGNAEIYLMNLDGLGQVNITNNPANDGDKECGPRWSPDGTEIAFSTNRDGNYEIYIMKPNGTGLRRLTFDPADDVSPAWSPDGNFIVFQSFRTGLGDIYVMDANGSSLKRLTSDPEFDGQPSWQPVPK